MSSMVFPLNLCPQLLCLTYWYIQHDVYHDEFALFWNQCAVQVHQNYMAGREVENSQYFIFLFKINEIKIIKKSCRIGIK